MTHFRGSAAFFVDLSISDQSIVGPISANIVFFSVKKQKNGSRRCVRIRYNDYLCIMNLSKESFVCQKRLI